MFSASNILGCLLLSSSALLHADFGTQVSYLWYPQREAFFRKTLNSGACDVVTSVPEGFRESATTQPYYRSAYVFVSRRDRHLDIRSLDDPRLHHLRVGVRKGNNALKDRLESELRRRKTEIRQVLRDYGIPQLQFSAASPGEY